MIKPIANVLSYFAKLIGKIHWSPTTVLSETECNTIKELLIPNYYIILTRRNNHLSTYAIAVGNFFLTGKFSYWSHVLMNTEDEVNDKKDFRLIEAIGTGIQFSPFDKVFDVQSVAILKPRHIQAWQWTAILDKAKTELGKPYDTLFDLKSDSALSCVELVRNALMAEDDYEINFANFEAMIAKNKNLTPEMFYNCPDFEVIYEIRH